MAGKRDYGEGSYRYEYEDEAKTKIKAIRLYVRYGKDENGKAIRKCFSGKTKRECKRKKEEYEALIGSRENRKPVHKLDAELDNWINTYVAGRVKPQTLARNQHEAKIIKRLLANMYVEELNADIIQRKFINELKKEGYSKGSIYDYSDLLKRFLYYEKQKGNIEINPYENRNIKSPAKKTTKKIRALTEFEKRLVLDVAGTKFKNGKHLYPYMKDVINFALNTGCRAGEIFALKPDAVSLKDNVIHIKRGLSTYSLNGKAVTTVNDYPKTDCSVRKIPMNNVVREIIENHYYDGEFIFMNKNNTHLHPQCVFSSLKNIKNRILDVHGYDMSFMTMHTFRHTFACDLYFNGIDAAQIQRLLGHESISTTLDTYVRLWSSIDPKTETMLADAVNSLG